MSITTQSIPKFHGNFNLNQTISLVICEETLEPIQYQTHIQENLTPIQVKVSDQISTIFINRQSILTNVHTVFPIFPKLYPDSGDFFTHSSFVSKHLPLCILFQKQFKTLTYVREFYKLCKQQVQKLNLEQLAAYTCTLKEISIAIFKHQNNTIDTYALIQKVSQKTSMKEVYAAIDIRTNKLAAIYFPKKSLLERYPIKQIYKDFKNEQILFDTLKNFAPKISGIEFVFTEGLSPIGVGQFHNSDLYEVIDTQQDLRKQHLYSWVLGILTTVSQLHKENYVHQDIKPENLLINSQDNNIYLCDLNTVSRNSNIAAVKDGTPKYWPPEKFELLSETRIAISPQFDAWAIGCVFYILVYCEPFISEKAIEDFMQGSSTQFDKELLKTHQKLNKDCSKSECEKRKALLYTMTQLLQRDPATRWTVNTAFSYLKRIIA